MEKWSYLFEQLGQHAQEGLAVGIVLVDGLTPVTAGGEVLRSVHE